MDFIVFKSLHDNCYLYSQSKKQFFNLDFVTYNILENVRHESDLRNITYYDVKLNNGSNITEKQFNSSIAKINYYISNGVFKQIDPAPYFKLNAETIKYQLANNPHIVFEVTERCNLKCKYCGYGDFYTGFDSRTNKDLSFDSAKNVIDYIVELSDSQYRISLKNEFDISFYGGEPLLRFDFIEKIIKYTEELKSEKLNFNFHMTTNAILLEKYMKKIVDLNIGLLISLDGNRRNHSYRLFPNNKESFSVVFNNLKAFQLNFPEYFNSSKVRFNAVLHNRNSVKEINEFIQKEFNKLPLISELNRSFVVDEKKDELLILYQNVYDSLNQTEDYYHLLSKENPMYIPDFTEGIHFIFKLTDFVYENYNDLKNGTKYKAVKKHTGTCLPFARKVFVTVNGKILPCENVNHEHSFGEVSESGIDLDYEKLAEKYNFHHERIKNICAKCYRSINYCSQCIYLLDLDEEKIQCHGFMTKSDFKAYLGEMVTYFEENPQHFKTIIDEITIN